MARWRHPFYAGWRMPSRTFVGVAPRLPSRRLKTGSNNSRPGSRRVKRLGQSLPAAPAFDEGLIGALERLARSGCVGSGMREVVAAQRASLAWAERDGDWRYERSRRVDLLLSQVESAMGGTDNADLGRQSGEGGRDTDSTTRSRP